MRIDNKEERKLWHKVMRAYPSSPKQKKLQAELEELRKKNDARLVSNECHFDRHATCPFPTTAVCECECHK